MARRRTRIPLNVWLNGRLVGTLRRAASGAIDFQYDPSWLEWEHSFPISLSLPLREDRYIGDPVIAVFDNLLPDNDEIRRHIAAEFHTDGIDAYSLLSAIGRDCIGALQFLADGTDPGPVGAVAGEPINDEGIAERLSSLEDVPLGLVEDEDFRISLAGVQDKMALLYGNGAWYVPRGSTATTHILKPQIGRRGNLDLSQSVENEHFCMRLLRALDMPAALTHIADFAGQRALVVERFDRRWARANRLLRLPQEDCCQALSVPPTRKYESDGGPGIVEILELLKGSDDPQRDRSLLIKAQITYWLMGATDGHAKNFSVFLYPGGGFRLTPLYDVMSTQPLLEAGQLRRNRMRLAMAAGDKRHYRVHDILPRHFVQTADRAGMPEETVHEILQELYERMPGAIQAVCDNLPCDFPDALRKAIVGGIEQRLRRMENAAS
ncbi:MAG TPA: type II toxin-antitoxin system HipA family toxin [Arenicellales bacterium]|nr:type II toxin-antitoxin system HipA family toxin [Arenicellales bacterium]